MVFKKILFTLFLVLSLSGAALSNDADQSIYTDDAKRIYAKYNKTIYQIQVIDIASNRKTSIGSGFQFTQDHVIGTNYHVVSEAVNNPKQYRIEYLTDEGKRGPLLIVAADIIHDLAIVRKTETDLEKTEYLNLGGSDLAKGTHIFSLGNPHDIGFTIIEGTYNGLHEKSLYKKIHFSGSLNPGMSGGPSLDKKGNVIGVNVSTAGNQISFLVPVEKLQELYKKSQEKTEDKKDFLSNADSNIEKMLFDNQREYIKNLIDKEWDLMTFGPVKLPGEVSDIFKCWGSPEHKDKDDYEHYSSTCSTQDDIYINKTFRTGPITYRYDHIKAKQNKISNHRFHNFYEELYGFPLNDYLNAGKDDVGSFKCEVKYLDNANEKWKTSFCIRKYKKYPSIYDMHLYTALLGQKEQGLIVSLIAQGVSQESSTKLVKKFISNVKPIDVKAIIKGDIENDR